MRKVVDTLTLIKKYKISCLWFPVEKDWRCERMTPHFYGAISYHKSLDRAVSKCINAE